MVEVQQGARPNANVETVMRPRNTMHVQQAMSERRIEEASRWGGNLEIRNFSGRIDAGTKWYATGRYTPRHRSGQSEQSRSPKTIGILYSPVK